MWRNLAPILMKHSIAFGLCISTFKTSTCDLVVQVAIEKKDGIDWKRNAFLGAFGFLYLDGAQYALYIPQSLGGCSRELLTLQQNLSKRKSRMGRGGRIE